LAHRNACAEEEQKREWQKTPACVSANTSGISGTALFHETPAISAVTSSITTGDEAVIPLYFLT